MTRRTESQRQWVGSEGERCYPGSTGPGWRACTRGDKKGVAGLWWSLGHRGEAGVIHGLAVKAWEDYPGPGWQWYRGSGQAEQWGAPFHPLCSHPSAWILQWLIETGGWRGAACKKEGPTWWKAVYQGEWNQEREGRRDRGGQDTQRMRTQAHGLLRLNEWRCSWQALTYYIGRGDGGGCLHCLFPGR